MAHKTIATLAVMATLFAPFAVLPAMAETGQCSFAEDPVFDCEIERDGTSFAFELTDGRMLVFQEIEPGLGYVYLDRNNGAERPKELGQFRPIEGEAGCWGAGDPPAERFCVLPGKEGT